MTTFLRTLVLVCIGVLFVLPDLIAQAGPAKNLRAVTCVAFSPDNKYLAVAGGWDGSKIGKGRRGGEGFLNVYALRDNKRYAAFADEFTNHVEQLYYFEKRTLVTISQYHVRESPSAQSWRTTRVSFFALASSPSPAMEIQRTHAYPKSVAYHPETDLLCGGSSGNTLLIKLGHGGGLDGQSPGIYADWPPSKGTRFGLKEEKERGHSVLRFSPDGKTLLCCTNFGSNKKAPLADPMARLYDTQTGKMISEFDPNGAVVEHAEFSADGKMLALLCHDKKIYVLTSDLKKKVFEFPVDHVSRAIALAPDGDLLAAATAPDKVTVFELPSGKARYTLSAHGEGVNCLAFSPDGVLLAVGCGNTERRTGKEITPGVARVWDVRTQKMVHEFK